MLLSETTEANDGGGGDDNGVFDESFINGHPLRGLSYVMSEQKGEVKRYPKFVDKQCRFCGQRGEVGGRG